MDVVKTHCWPEDKLFAGSWTRRGGKKLSSTRKSRPAGQKQFLRPGDDVAANRRHSIQLENTTCSYCWCCCVFISPDTMQKASDCQDLRINNEYSATQSSSEQLRAKATTRLAGWQHPYAALTAKEKYCESNSARWKKERRKQEKKRVPYPGESNMFVSWLCNLYEILTCSIWLI